MPSTEDAEPPRLSRRFACIVDREATTLAALISSYIFVPETYLPLFLLRKAKVSRTGGDLEFMSDAYLAEAMLGPDSVFIANALSRLGDPEYIILAGLTDAQASYLRLPASSSVIEIATPAEVESKLLPLVGPREQLNCRPEEILTGLVLAQRQQRRLVLDETATPIGSPSPSLSAAVIVERTDEAASIVAINYGSSVDASIFFVQPLAEGDSRQIQHWIQEWKEADSTDAYRRLAAEVYKRVGSIPFKEFDHATFFTAGIPYSVFLDDVIPFSYVNLRLRCDLFILNCIIFSRRKGFGSAVVFSPTFFEDEETTWLSEFLRRQQYDVRSLVGHNSTLAAFDFTAQYYPYDMLHLCSHGGEVGGYEMTATFLDQEGKTHTVEFEEVIGTTPSEEPGMLRVHRKMLPKTLDGLPWMSPELKKHGLPGHVLLSMWKCMSEAKGARTPKNRVAMSCAIACIDSIHQGQLDSLASYSSPFVFNNTCWSSSEVAAFFLACGARGYIGTLWAIDNDAAVTGARTFYENLFTGTVLSAFRKATMSIAQTASKGVYVYWGLPFSRVSPPEDARQARLNVTRELVCSVERWIEHIESTKHTENRSNSLRVLRLLFQELSTRSPASFSEAIGMNLRRRIPDLFEGGATLEETRTPSERRSLDGPIEHRPKDGFNHSL